MTIEVVFVGTGDASNTGARANQSVLIRAWGKSILLDCGPTTLYRLEHLGFSANDLDAILFTHFHGDHFAGVVFVDLALTIVANRTHEIIYGGARGIEKQFQRLYRACYPSFYPNDQFERRFQEFLPECSYSLWDNITLFPIAIRHSNSSLGYRLKIGDKTIAVSGDSVWSNAIPNLARDTDLFICECSFDKEVPEGYKHLAYKQLVDNRRSLKARRTLLLHCGKEMLDRQESIFEVAKDGMQILL